MTHSLNAQLAAQRIARMHCETEQRRRVELARRSATRMPRAGRFQRRS